MKNFPFKELKTLAVSGNSDAQVELANRYYFGRGVKKNIETATQWYKKAGGQGNPTAEYWLSSFCIEDEEQSLQLLKKSAEQGYEMAKYDLAIRYLEGNGVEEEAKRAIELLLELAEEYDNIDAKYELAICYEHGIGIDVDFLQSIYWYKECAKQTLPERKKIYPKIAKGTLPLPDVTWNIFTAQEMKETLDKIYELASELCLGSFSELT